MSFLLDEMGLDKMGLDEMGWYQGHTSNFWPAEDVFTSFIDWNDHSPLQATCMAPTQEQ